jgi:hypothetical protein
MYASSADVRDKIYGIVSLLKPETRAMIPVDYSRHYLHILRDVMVACIEECEDLTMLLYTASHSSVDGSTNVFGLQEFQNFLRNSTRIYSSLQSGRLNLPYVPTTHLTRSSRPETICQFSARPNRILGKCWLPLVSTRSSETAAAHDMESADTNLPAKSLISRSSYPRRDHPGSQMSLRHQILPCLQVRGHLIDISQGLMAVEARRIATDFSLMAVRYGPKNFKWLARYFTSPESNKLSSPDDRIIDRHHQCLDNGGRVQYSGKDIADFLRYIQSNENAENAFMFQTHYSVGFTTTKHGSGDFVFAVDGVPEPLVLRHLGNETYRILGSCYLWAALELDYWNVGSHLGLWPERPYDLGTEQTRLIKIY